MQARVRYYASALTSDGVRDATVARIIATCQQDESLKRITLITRRVSDKSFLETFFGSQDVVKMIGSGFKFPTTNLGVLHSSIDKFHSIEEEIVITLGLTSDELLTLEDNLSSHYLIAVPWLKDEVNKWSRITEASPVADGSKAIPFEEPPCIVIQALQDLNTINKTFVPFHDSDQNRIKTYAAALHKNGVPLQLIVLEAYLIRVLNWQKRSVDAALEIFSAVIDGRRIRGKVGETRDHLSRWKQACSGNNL